MVLRTSKPTSGAMSACRCKRGRGIRQRVDPDESARCRSLAGMKAQSVHGSVAGRTIGAFDTNGVKPSPLEMIVADEDALTPRDSQYTSDIPRACASKVKAARLAPKKLE